MWKKFILMKEILWIRQRKGMYLIDMTTTSPMISKKIYEEGKKKGVHVVDAPVTGGDSGAKATEHFLFWSVATRKIMRLVCRYLKLWERISIIREKLDVDSMPRWVNQIMIAGTMSGLCEALSYAKAKDLDCETVLKSVATGAAGSKQLDFLWREDSTRRLYSWIFYETFY